MLFRLLGSLQVCPDRHQPVDIGPPLQRAVLATLLIEPGRPVAVARLVRELWADQPPATATKNIQGYVHKLRRLLDAEPGVAIRTTGGGYAIDVGPDDVDVTRFRALVATAGRRTPAEADALLTEALALWRGPALADVPTDAARAFGRRLDAERLDVVERQSQIRLDAGRHLEVIPALTQLVHDEPLRENPYALLILALYRAGRYAEALTTYRDAHAAFVAELGVEPGAVLAELHGRVLRRDPALNGVPATVGVPAREREQDGPGRDHDGASPARPGDSGGPERAADGQLVGRAGALAELDAVADATGRRLVVVDGLGGVGKTALALHWADRARAGFPDGLLYVDLHGVDPQRPPLSTPDVVSRLLARLGLADRYDVPDVARRLDHWHREVSSRRCIVVLDNAASADQVRAVLPSTGPAMTIVTSRTSLAALVAADGAYHIGLDVLGAADALALLRAMLGRRPVDRDLGAATQVADHCGRLPLALRVAAARLLTSRGRTLRDLASELDHAGALDALAVDGDPRASVSTVLGLSDAALGAAARRMLRYVAAVPGADVDLAGATALAGGSADEAAAALRVLVATHLVQPRGDGRYAQHDLVRAYALARTDELLGPDGLRAARARLLDHYARRVVAACDRLGLPRLLVPERAVPAADQEPGFADAAAATDWLETERANLVAAIATAADELPDAAWRLAILLRGFLRLRRHGDDWVTVAELGLRAAQAVGEADAEVAGWHSLGHARWSRGEYEPAAGNYRRALELSERISWDEGTMAAHSALGAVRHEQGRHAEAVDHYERALAVAGADRFPALAIMSAGGLGLAHESTGALHEALRAYRMVLNWCREQKSADFIATSLGNIGACELALGRTDDAETALDEALTLYREAGSPNGEANVLVSLAVLAARQDHAEAAAYRSALALRLARDIGDPRIESDARYAAGVAAHRRGDHATADEHLSAALEVARGCGYDRGLPATLIALARLRADTGDLRGALRLAEQARAMAQTMGHHGSRSEAETLLATLHLRLGGYDTARELALDGLRNAELVRIDVLREAATDVLDRIAAALPLG